MLTFVKNCWICFRIFWITPLCHAQEVQSVINFAMYVLDDLDQHRPPTNNDHNLTWFWATENRSPHICLFFLCIYPHWSCYYPKPTHATVGKKKTINQPLNFDGETLEGLNINGTSRIVHVFLGRIWQARFWGSLHWKLRGVFVDWTWPSKTSK